MRGTIPAILNIDVEPDGFQSPANGSTTAYDAIYEVIERLRPRLAEATGRAPRFGWFFRMDPQVDAVFGRPDHLVTGPLGERVQHLRDAGDHIGLHTHTLRQSATQDAWVHDMADAAWVQHVIASSAEAFEGTFGMPCTRHRMGARAYTEDIVDALGRAGVLVELAFEPEGLWGAEDTLATETALDASPLTGHPVDCAKIAASCLPTRAR